MIRIAGNHFVDGHGQEIRLLGVNFAGVEGACVDPGFQQGATDQHPGAVFDYQGPNPVVVPGQPDQPGQALTLGNGLTGPPARRTRATADRAPGRSPDLAGCSPRPKNRRRPAGPNASVKVSPLVLIAAARKEQDAMRESTDFSGTKNAAARRRRPWLPRLIPPVSPLAAVAIFSLLFGGAGFADAATGGAFILGKPNSETTQSSLSDKHGTPLSLTAPRGDAPLAVNRTAQVKNLNAEYVGGFRATQLAVTGGAGVTAFDSSLSIGQTPSEVATTGTLRSGIYYVSASAELSINPSDADGACWIALGSNPDAQIAQSYVPGQGDFPVAQVSAVRVTAGDTLQEVCDAGGNTGSTVFGPNIFAIRVVASSNG